jgi:hypothetical protein
MCQALDMPCGAGGDLDHIEFAKQIYRIRISGYIDFAKQKYRQTTDAPEICGASVILTFQQCNSKIFLWKRN